MKQGQKLSIKTKAKVVIRKSENFRVSKCSLVRSAIMIRGAVQKRYHEPIYETNTKAKRLKAFAVE